MTTPKVAVIGCGHWGRNLVRVFHELGALAMVCDTNPKRLEQVPEDVEQTVDLRHVLESSVQGVVIAAPAATHAGITGAILRANKDVLVEKPMALNSTDAWEMCSLAALRSCILMVGHVLLYHPAVTALRSLVSAGELGEIQYIYSNRLNMGKARTEESVLWSFAPHDIAVMLMLLDESPVSATCHGKAYIRSSVPDVAVASLDFPSGAAGHIFVSWLHPYKRHDLVVVGSQAMVVFDDTRPTDKLLLYRYSLQGGQPVAGNVESIPYAPDAPLKLECQDFLRCIEKRERPVSDAVLGLKVVEVLDRCQKSLSTQQR